jgi:hypothetical protein
MRSARGSAQGSNGVGAWLLAGIVSTGCAFGEDGSGGSPGNDDAWTPGDTATSSDSGESEAGGKDDGSEGVADDAEGGDEGVGGSCEAGCASPPGDCFEAEGSCEDDACVYPPKLAGETCSDGCSGSGFCDASGSCICSGGDGDTGNMTEDCESTCVSGPNASAACDENGACIVTCTAPYEDCDGDPINGCEIPVGVPHSCDSGGINMTGGCWSAYCGQSAAATATNFGSYYCADCPTCTELAGGLCHWCNHDTGNFFPTESCSCGAQYLNVACGG